MTASVLPPVPFGAIPGGPPVHLWLLESDSLRVGVTTLGASLQQLWAPDRDGTPANVLLGLPDADGYAAQAAHYLGATVGRFANRIAGGRFVLDGEVHELSRNEAGATLHGGAVGFSRHVWEAEAGPRPGTLTLRRRSPDGEMGFPGTLDAEVAYSLAGSVLRIAYRAVCDRLTVVGLACHAYWNLAGEGAGSIDGHTLAVPASRWLRVGPGLLPTGELAPVDGTGLDLRRPTLLGQRLREGAPELLAARGLDHCLVLDDPGLDPARPPVRLAHPASGRALELRTTEPGLQVYAGNVLDGSFAGTSGRAYRQGDGIALEAQRLPDAPNKPHFPSAVLRPGEVYAATTELRLTADADQPEVEVQRSPAAGIVEASTCASA